MFFYDTVKVPTCSMNYTEISLPGSTCNPKSTHAAMSA